MKTLGCLLLISATLAGCTDGRLDAFARVSSATEGNEPGGSSAGGASAQGSHGLAGEVGEGGAPAAAGAGQPGQSWLLDDLEDGDTRGLGSSGYWYVVNDGTGSQELAVEATARGTSARALRTRGSGFSDWGAKLGLDLSVDDGPFDASAYGGLAFFARAEGGSLTSVRVVLLDHAAHYGKDLQLTQSWQRYRVAFSDLTQPNGTGGLDPSRLQHLQFFAGPSAAFDYSLDDIEMTP